MTRPVDGQVQPVYLIVSDQPALINLEIEKIKRRMGRATLDFNYDQLDALQVTGLEIISKADTPPFMSDWRLIVVKDVDKLSKGETVHLLDYLKNPFPTTCLVLVGEGVSDKSALYKGVSAVGEIIIRNLERGKIPAMIKKGFHKRGQVASDALVKYLISAVGEDLNRLGNEIEKISLYCQGEKVISLEEARHVVSHADETRIFELTDRIGRRDVLGALRALEQLTQVSFERKPRPKSASAVEGRPGWRRTGEAGFRVVSKEEHARLILYLLANHFRALLRAKALLEDGADGHQIIQKLSIKGTDKTKSFLFNKYRQQSQNFAIDELKRATYLFSKADLALKSTGQPPDGVLEMLVVSLTSL